MMEAQIPVGIDTKLYRNILVEIKKKIEKVRFIMENIEETRNDDSLLCLMYWKLVEGAERLEDIVWLTKPEVIRRARQKIQEKGMLLPTNEEVYKRRHLNKKIVRQGIRQIN